MGLHYFNPAQVMKLVEVIRCVTTSDEAFSTALEFARSEGKLAIPTQDKAGFIVNRLLVPYMLDAIRAYEEGVGSVGEIDEAMKAGAGHPMGPLTLADFVGLDTLGSICDVLFEEFRERRFAALPMLRKMLSAGWFGRKSGMGFYDYSSEEPDVDEDVGGVGAPDAEDVLGHLETQARGGHHSGAPPPRPRGREQADVEAEGDEQQQVRPHVQGRAGTGFIGRCERDELDHALLADPGGPRASRARPTEENQVDDEERREAPGRRGARHPFILGSCDGSAYIAGHPRSTASGRSSKCQGSLR